MTQQTTPYKEEAYPTNVRNTPELSIVSDEAHLSKKAPQPALNYRPDIDGLRAIAVLSVVIYHLFPSLIPGGFLGVDIFFVISGYLISTIIFTQLQNNTFSFADFYIRRIKRIFPTLIFVLSFVGIASWVICTQKEFTSITKLMRSSTIFYTNFSLYKEIGYFDVSASMKPLLHIWSLSIEEQYYIFFPAFIFAIHRYKCLVLPFLLIGLIASFSMDLYWLSKGSSKAFYYPQARAWELIIGAILAYTYQNSSAIPEGLKSSFSSTSAQNIFAIIGISAIAYTLFFMDEKSGFPGWPTWIPTLSVVLLLASPKSFINKGFLSNRLVVWVGLISYSLYLWHWPLYSFTQIHTNNAASIIACFIILFLSFALAAATTFWIEKPIRHSHKNSYKKLCIGMATLFMICIPLSKGWIKPLPYLINPAIEKILFAIDDWEYDNQKFNDKDPRDFPFPSFGSGPETILFYGDSNMQQYWPRIEWLMTQDPHIKKTYTAIFATYGGEPPIPNSFPREQKERSDFNNKAFPYLHSDQYKTIVISAQWQSYMGKMDETADVYFKNLKNMLLQLKADGKKVFLILNIPVAAEQAPASMYQRNLFKPWIASNIKTMPRHEAEDSCRQVKERMIQIAKETGTITLDPFDMVCQGDTCNIIDAQGNPIYKDAGHLTATFVKQNAFIIDRIFKE